MSDSKMSDREFNGIIGLLALQIRRDVVRSLLAGNDTQCFSIEQYKAEYEKQRPMPEGYARPGLYWRLDPSCDLARKHLLSVPELVREVEPGIWAATGETP